MDWSDIRTLLELSREGSLSAAARRLNVTHATISRRIERLEAALGGTPLFRRDTGRYVPTDLGRRIIEVAQPMEEAALAVERAGAGLQHRVAGPVIITATEAVASYVVAPLLHTMSERNPEVEVNLKIGNHQLSLSRREADIAIRLLKPDVSPGIVTRRLCDLAFYFYGSVDYLSKRRSDATAYIGYTDEFAQWPEALTLQKYLGNGRLSVRTDNLGTRLSAVRLGLGLGLLPRFLAENFPDIARAESGPPVMTREMHLLVHADMLEIPRIRQTADFVADAIVSRRDKFEALE